jgi:hypothetical protein
MALSQGRSDFNLVDSRLTLDLHGLAADYTFEHRT